MLCFALRKLDTKGVVGTIWERYGISDTVTRGTRSVSSDKCQGVKEGEDARFLYYFSTPVGIKRNSFVLRRNFSGTRQQILSCG
jgi:hypothetical protein